MPYQRSYGPTDYSYVDPRGSFFGNVFRAVGGVVGGAVKGFLKGGPIGGIVGAVAGSVSATQANIASDAASPLQTPGSSSAGTPSVALARLPPPAGAGVVVSPGGTVVNLAAHNAAVAAARGGMSAATLGEPGTRGFHIIKKGPHAGQVTRNRHMNWANHRALGRAERRIHSAVKHMSKYIRWVHPKKEGHAAPHFGRKRHRAR